MVGIDTKSIYVTQFPGDKKFWICRCTESNFGIPLFGIEVKEAAESLGRKVAEVLGVAFYASKAKDLWSECTEVPFYSFVTFRVTKTLSDECGLYVEDQSERRRLLFASSDPDEIKRYASEISKLFNVPVKVDAEIEYCKPNSIGDDGGKKMAKSKKINKMQLCRNLMAQGVSDDEIIKQLTEANISEGKDPAFAAKRAKVVFKYLKRKVKGGTATTVKKDTSVVKKETAEVSEAESTVEDPENTEPVESQESDEVEE